MKTATADSPTKDRLLDAAQQLMLAKGFVATTVDEICDAAKLTKGSFFHYFDSKDHLGQELLARFCASEAQRHADLVGAEPDPVKRVLAYVDGIIACSCDSTMSKGCLLGTFAQELSDTHPKIRSACAKGFEAWAKKFSAELAKAKAAARATFDPLEVAEHFIAVLEGSLILAKARQDPSIIGRNAAHFRAYLTGLLKR